MAEVHDIDVTKESSGSDSQEPLIEEQSADAVTTSSGFVDELDHGDRGMFKLFYLLV